MHAESFNEKNKELDLYELFQILWNKKIYVITISIIAAIISIGISLYLPNTYTSKATLAPTETEKSLYSQLGGLSAIAGFADIGLSSDSASKSQEALERVKSFEFFSKYFLPNVKLENVVAVKNWLSDSNTITYNQTIYNSKTNQWLDKPSEQKAYSAFKKMLEISVDNKTSFITLSIEHKSPYLAKQWVDIIVHNINESMRELDIRNAKNSITFLNESTSSTSVQSIREVIASLLERQMQTLMLASSNADYVWKTIDSSLVPELKSGPNRAFICIVGTLLGSMLSMIFVFILHYRESQNN